MNDGSKRARPELEGKREIRAWSSAGGGRREKDRWENFRRQVQKQSVVT